MSGGGQYESICRPRMDKLESSLDRNGGKIHEIHRVVTNGLIDKVDTNKKNIEKLDNRLWLLLSGMGLSIVLQVVFQLI